MKIFENILTVLNEGSKLAIATAEYEQQVRWEQIKDKLGRTTLMTKEDREFFVKYAKYDPSL